MHTKLPLEHHMIAIQNNRIQNGYCIISQKVRSFFRAKKVSEALISVVSSCKISDKFTVQGLMHAFSVTASLFMMARVVLNNCVCIFCYYFYKLKALVTRGRWKQLSSFLSLSLEGGSAILRRVDAFVAFKCCSQ